ncbi:MAG: glutamine-hydrolyzing GMP synthase, partial [Gammaproteobacteria bacterium]|nr:glutamine-hydrolyzing GMP synthase [Gammaproteobacteria bacterium]
MTTDIHAKRILILDFGSQYTQLIARRIREIGVYCEIHSYHISDDEIHHFAPSGIILSGGPESVTDKNAVRAPDSVFQLGCPVLGICYGMQTMAEQLGGKVSQGSNREFGYAEVTLEKPSPLLNGIEDKSPNILDVWMSHGDHVSIIPPEFTIIASSTNCEIIGMADEKRHFYGLQFHPEVSHTKQGMRILEKFILDICACEPKWTIKNIIDESITAIQQQVGSDHVILGLSGGVDSSVLATLLHRAIGTQLTCVFVDTGLLRLNEAIEVENLFAKHLGIHLITVNAENEFLTALAGIDDPETKRKIIGKLFIDIFEREANKIKNAKWLAQGTIYSDVIESAATKTGKAHLIKSHHNVGGLPEKMHLKLLEPLRELFKDEVRKMGLELGLPHDLIHRHPFPGPGLAVRILGEVKKEYADKLRRADAILIQELYKNDLYYKVSQAFVVFLPVKSVGVLGDARHYDHVVAIRVVETIDFMTAHSARLPYELLEKISNRIINEVPGISRVVYDVSSKPPATIEWE